MPTLTMVKGTQQVCIPSIHWYVDHGRANGVYGSLPRRMRGEMVRLVDRVIGGGEYEEVRGRGGGKESGSGRLGLFSLDDSMQQTTQKRGREG